MATLCNAVGGPVCGCVATVSFEFTQSLKCAGDNPITVTGPDVVVDMKGFTLEKDSAAGDLDGNANENTGISFEPTAVTSGGTVKNGVIKDFDVGVNIAGAGAGEFLMTEMFFQNQFEHAISSEVAGATLTVVQSTFDSVSPPESSPEITPYIAVSEFKTVNLTSNLFRLGPHSGAEISEAEEINAVGNIFQYVSGVVGDPEDTALFGINVDGGPNDIDTASGTIQGNCFTSDLLVRPTNSVGVLFSEASTVAGITGNTFNGLVLGVDVDGNLGATNIGDNCLAKNQAGIAYGIDEDGTARRVGNVNGNTYFENVGDILVQTVAADPDSDPVVVAQFITIAGSKQATLPSSGKGSKSTKSGSKSSKKRNLSSKGSSQKVAAVPCACPITNAGRGMAAVVPVPGASSSRKAGKSGKKSKSRRTVRHNL